MTFLANMLAWGPVHPHGCGEHYRDQKTDMHPDGSSPRVWGTFENLQRNDITERFIPTGVGNISTRGGEAPWSAVHPHGCGEHFRKEDTMEPASGSSPRVWGTYKQDEGCSSRHRFIPTGVGNMNRLPRPAPPPAVHPHGCGEHIPIHLPAAKRIGSSPRVWGTCSTSQPKGYR